MVQGVGSTLHRALTFSILMCTLINVKSLRKKMKTNFPQKGEKGFRSENKGVGREISAISVKFPSEIDKVLRSLPNRSDYIRNAIAKQLVEDGLIEQDGAIAPNANAKVKIKDRLNNLAREFYLQMGYRVKEGFDFTASRHPQELMCYRMAEIAYEEFNGDRPDYADDEED